MDIEKKHELFDYAKLLNRNVGQEHKKYFSVMLNLKVVICSFAAVCGITSAAERVDLEKAVREDKVEVSVTGLGASTGDAILIIAKRKVQQPLRLTMAPGTVFTSDSIRVQNMAGGAIKGERITEKAYRASPEIELSDDEQHAYIVEAFCLDFQKDNPAQSDSFAISSPDARVVQVLNSGKRWATTAVVQTAIWMDRDKVLDDQLKKRFRVTDLEIGAARALLQDVDNLAKGKNADAVATQFTGAKVASYLEKNAGVNDKLVLFKGSPRMIAELKEPLLPSILEKEFGKPDVIETDFNAFTQKFVAGQPEIRWKGECWRYGNVGVFIYKGKIIQFADFTE